MFGLLARLRYKLKARMLSFMITRSHPEVVPVMLEGIRTYLLSLTLEQLQGLEQELSRFLRDAPVMKGYEKQLESYMEEAKFLARHREKSGQGKE